MNKIQRNEEINKLFLYAKENDGYLLLKDFIKCYMI